MNESHSRKLIEQSLGSYLTRLAASDSTPGGGTAAGLTGAQAAALLSMVCNLSQGKKFAAIRTTIVDLERSCEDIRFKMLALCNDDIDVFNDVMAAYRLPKTSPIEEETRSKAIQRSLIAAAQVPLAMMKEVSLLLPHADQLARIGNPNLISDVGVAVHLIDASLASARLNVLINARKITDTIIATSLRTTTTQLMDNLAQLKPVILSKVEEGVA